MSLDNCRLLLTFYVLRLVVLGPCGTLHKKKSHLSVLRLENVRETCEAVSLFFVCNNVLGHVAKREECKPLAALPSLKFQPANRWKLHHKYSSFTVTLRGERWTGLLRDGHAPSHNNELRS